MNTVTLNVLLFEINLLDLLLIEINLYKYIIN